MRVRTDGGYIVEVTPTEAKRIRKLRRKYDAELMLTPLGTGGIVGLVYGHEVIRIDRKETYAMTHTPGPWTLKRTNRGMMVYGNVDGGPVAEVIGTMDGGNISDHGNAGLIFLAPTAPHDCDVPGCPGPENKRKLEAFEELLEAARATMEAVKTGTTSGNPYTKRFVKLAEAAIATAEERN